MMDKNELMNSETDNNFGSILNENVVDTTSTKKDEPKKDVKKQKIKSKFDDDEQEDNYEVPDNNDDEKVDTNEKGNQHLTYQGKIY